jgi:Protein of unknown function (DUF2384)
MPTKTKARQAPEGRLAELLGSVMTPAAGRAWWGRPNRSLAGATPAELVANGHAEDVEALLLALAEGVVM